MMTIDIPGFEIIEAQHLVMGFNGTIAMDGKLLEGIRDLLKLLSKDLKIHILTADTYETVVQELKGIDCNVEILNPSLQDIQKDIYVQKIGEKNTIAIGSALNNAQILKNSVLGISVIQKGGASIKSLINADIVVTNIIDALELLLNPQRLIATLRN